MSEEQDLKETNILPETEEKVSEDIVEEKKEEIESSPQEEQSETSTKRKILKKGIFDYNLSLLTFFFVLALMVTITLCINLVYMPNVSGGFYVKGQLYNSILFIVMSFLVGILLSFITYNGGKILGAKLSNYKIQYVCFFGLTLERLNEKLNFKFSPKDILEFHLKFTPGDLEKCKPHLFLSLGFATNLCLSILLIGLGLGLFQNENLQNDLTGLTLTGMFVAGLYSLLIPFYEAIPLKNDYDNDTFTLLNVRNPEDVKAYNILLKNVELQQNYKDFIVPEFDSYVSYYKAQTLYFKYLDKLYDDKIKDAAAILNECIYLSKFLPIDLVYAIQGEKIYLISYKNDNSKTRKLYLSLRKDNKKAIVETKFLSDYHVALTVSGLILNSREEINDIIDRLNKMPLKMEYKSNKCEINHIRNVLKRIKEVNPDMQLTDLRNFE